MKSSKMFKSVAAITLTVAMVIPMVASTSGETQAAKKMSISPKSATLYTGATKNVKIKGVAKKAKITWKSSNKKVASVSSKAKKATVKAVSAGTAKITAVVKKGKKKTTVSGVTVKVRQKIADLKMQDTSSKAVTSTTLKPNQQMVLKAAINNNASGSTTNQVVKWSSSNSKVVSVKKKNVNQATITAVANGTATITAVAAPNSKVDKKTVTCTITVKGTPVATPKPTAKPKPTYPPGVVYEQKYDVTRWYDPATAATSENGHAHDGYKNNSFAIWMVGFFENQYSTNEDTYNEGVYGPALDDYKGKPLNVKGEFKYDGTNQKTVLFQINYTQPSDYPILWKWEKGASKAANEYAKELSISGINGSDNVDAGKWTNLNVTFTIPKNAVNGDKDDASGENFGIYLYFPNKPGGALTYVKSNTFHFRNFKITEK